MQIIRANERHLADHGWLQSHFLFSFANYYDPNNSHFGPLRVFNDDRFAAHSGFPQHPHSNMEIITIMLNGTLTHQDTMGNKKTLSKGEVQRMTAGTGLAHSEMNEGDEEVHLYQIWFMPGTKDLTPSYEQKDMKFMDKKNELIPLVTGQKVIEDVLFMNSNSSIYWCNLDENELVPFESFEVRKAFAYVNEGELSVNGIAVSAGDQVRIDKPDKIAFRGISECKFILIDLPSEYSY